MSNKSKCYTITLLSLCLCGCETSQPHTASDAINSYVNYTNEESFHYTGSVTLPKGKYVVISDANANCTVESTTHIQYFSSREYIEVLNDVQVVISHGKLIPLQIASALNADVVTEGVYLVGFDTLPNKMKMANGQYLAIMEKMPILFEEPIFLEFSKWDEFDATDGMCVRLYKSYLVDRTDWDIEGKLVSYDSKWVDTSIDNKRGDKYKEDMYYTFLEEGVYYRLTSSDDLINIETPEKAYRCYNNRIWFKAVKNMKIKAEGALLLDETEVFTMREFTGLKGFYLVGKEIPAGTYNIVYGVIQVLSQVPTVEQLSDMTGLLKSAPRYNATTIELKEGQVVYGLDADLRKLE